eukprot:2454527-Amphidinium_carterae.1
MLSVQLSDMLARTLGKIHEQKGNENGLDDCGCCNWPTSNSEAQSQRSGVQRCPQLVNSCCNNVLVRGFRLQAKYGDCTTRLSSNEQAIVSKWCRASTELAL